jgi:hypothetical protein
MIPDKVGPCTGSECLFPAEAFHAHIPLVMGLGYSAAAISRIEPDHFRGEWDVFASVPRPPFLPFS